MAIQISGGFVSDAETVGDVDWRRWAGCGLVAAAVLFNPVLCFLATIGVPVGLPVIIGAELSIIIAAMALIWRQAFQTLFVEGVLVGLYCVALHVVNPSSDPKIGIELTMIAAFCLLGRYKATHDQASKLVWFLVIVAVAFGLFEYLAQSTFEQLFNIFSYYVGKGDLTVYNAGDTGTNLAENGMRPEGQGRELLPGLLGLHRVGSVFLEPISAGNFATICSAWILATRYYRPAGFVLLFLSLVVGVLADARFAIFSSAAIAAVLMTPIWRSRLFVASLPFAAVLSLMLFGAIDHHLVDNTIVGRLHFSGDLLDNWTLANWLGFTEPSERAMDTGYSYLVGNLGLIPILIIWAMLCIREEETEESARFFSAITVYGSLSFCISGSFLSIKTAALLWFLYGVLKNPRQAERSRL
jgi:putative polymerase